jgi:hypothetical protein
MKNYDYNFQPSVKCPHCGKRQNPCISGFGGELSTRTKLCHFCQKEYRLVTYSFTDKDTENTTCAINSKLKRIEYLKKKIYNLLNNITDKTEEFAKEYLRIEALKNNNN